MPRKDGQIIAFPCFCCEQPMDMVTPEYGICAACEVSEHRGGGREAAKPPPAASYLMGGLPGNRTM